MTLPLSATRRARPLYLGLAVLVLLGGFALRVYGLARIPDGLHNDETVYLYRAWRFADGYGMPLYFYDAPEPFDAMVRAVWLRLAGITPFASHVFSVLQSLVAVALVGRLARRLYRGHAFNREMALVAMLALTSVPAYVIISRSIYRAAWIVPLPLLALWCLLVALASARPRDFGLAGVCSALALMFYLSGLMFPLVVLALALLLRLVYRRPLPAWRNTLAYLAGFGLMLLPWLFLLVSIPNWLTTRLEVLPGINPVRDPGAFLAALVTYGQSVALPTPATQYIQYTTLTSGHLNPALLLLALIGVPVLLWHWRRPFWLLPLLLLGAFALPAILSGEPDHPLRLIGTYAPLALIVAAGAGALLRLARPWLAAPLLLALTAGSLAYTTVHVRYHFDENPAIRSDPYTHSGLHALYHLGVNAFNRHVLNSPQPLYVPMALVLHPNVTVILRPQHYHTVRGYRAGEALPDGAIILPPRTGYDFPPYGLAQQYALLLPASGEIVILPALPADEAAALQQRVETTGIPLFTPGPESWQIGITLPVQGAAVFGGVVTPQTPVNAVFDDTLRLVALHVPRAATPGQLLRPTLFLEVLKPTATDYWMVVQAFDHLGGSRGSTTFWIYNWLYPTPMWQPGQVIPVVAEIPLFADAPPGAYRLSIGVFVKPRDTFVPVVDATDTRQAGERLLAGRFVVPLPPAPPPPATAVALESALVNDTLQLTHIAFDPPPADLAAGRPLALTLYWQVLRPPAEDATLFIHVQDSAGNIIAQHDGPPFDGRYPTGHWLPGETVATTVTLNLPDTATDNRDRDVTLYAGWYHPVTLARLPVTQQGTRPPDDRLRLAAFTLP